MFPPSTKILMADGSEKPIGDIELDDVIIGADCGKAVVSVIATQFYDGVAMRIDYDDGGHVLATPGQLLMTDRGKVEIRDIVPGDKVETYLCNDDDVVLREVYSSAHISYRGEVMGLRVDGKGGVYFAGGVSVVEDTPIVP